MVALPSVQQLGFVAKQKRHRSNSIIAVAGRGKKMARRRLSSSKLTVLAIAVPVCLYTSAILVILELGWGDPVFSILITHSYRIGTGVDAVANVRTGVCCALLTIEFLELHL